jgi:arsenate reductase (glutaredoxin)
MATQVYGIPTCGTCKKAFKWLENNSINYEFVNTKEQPPTKEMIEKWVASLGAKSMRNTSGQSYRALGEEKNDWTDSQWIAAFAQDAMLLKRPLFVKDGMAVSVGFRDKDSVIREKLGL